VTNCSAFVRSYGSGIVVQRSISGSWHWASTWSMSEMRWARRAIVPSRRVGAVRGQLPVMPATLTDAPARGNWIAGGLT
jgi:hypothetical protein